jgi:hypothetical protein
MNRDETSDRKRSGPRKNEMPDQGVKKKTNAVERSTEERPDLTYYVCLSGTAYRIQTVATLTTSRVLYLHSTLASVDLTEPRANADWHT